MTGEYGLNLDGDWNTDFVVGHKGAHSKNYHKFVLKEMKKFITIQMYSPKLRCDGSEIKRLWESAHDLMINSKGVKSLRVLRLLAKL